MTTITSRSLAYRCTPSGLQGRQHSHRAVRSRAHTQKRSLTTCQIVESESPSLVDRVLKIFATPANSLNEGIATFYDESSGLWEDMWGEHMHHGYYEVGQPVKNHQEAQVDMIDNSLKWAGVDEVTSMLDVGCGIGGSSRHIARKFNCAATGITLSPKQAERANMITKEAKLENVQFQVADALNQPFPDNSFDFVWSMESGEHMPDKEKAMLTRARDIPKCGRVHVYATGCQSPGKEFIAELARVCKPGGRILIVTWCHRVLEEGETQLKPDEQALLKNICSAYYLPAWCSIADYARIATANNLSGFTGLLKAGAGTLRGALVMPLMKTGLVKGTIKFNMMTAVKPST